MLPKDLLKYLEKRDDTIKDLKKSRSKEASLTDLARYVDLSTNSMWVSNSWHLPEQLGNQLSASANQTAMGLAQYSLGAQQANAIAQRQGRHE